MTEKEIQLEDFVVLEDFAYQRNELKSYAHEMQRPVQLPYQETMTGDSASARQTDDSENPTVDRGTLLSRRFIVPSQWAPTRPAAWCCRAPSTSVLLQPQSEELEESSPKSWAQTDHPSLWSLLSERGTGTQIFTKTVPLRSRCGLPDTRCSGRGH